MKLEHEIQNEIIEYCRNRGYVVVRHNPVRIVGNGIFVKMSTQDRGVSDLIVFKPGRAVCIEVKKPGGKQSLEQKAFQKAIEEVGQMYILADCLEDVSRFI
jgi:hypothetical protein